MSDDPLRKWRTTTKGHDMNDSACVEGWSFPPNSERVHYFRTDRRNRLRSLCGRWDFDYGDLWDRNPTTLSDYKRLEMLCGTCKRSAPPIVSDGVLPPARVALGRRLQLNPQPLRVRVTKPITQSATQIAQAEKDIAETRSACRHRAGKPHDHGACPYKEEHEG